MGQTIEIHEYQFSGQQHRHRELRYKLTMAPAEQCYHFNKQWHHSIGRTGKFINLVDGIYQGEGVRWWVIWSTRWSVGIKKGGLLSPPFHFIWRKIRLKYLLLPTYILSGITGVWLRGDFPSHHSVHRVKGGRCRIIWFFHCLCVNFQVPDTLPEEVVTLTVLLV